MNRFSRAAAAALLLGCSVVPQTLRAAVRAECLSAPSKILGHPVAYCVILPPSYDPEKTRRFPILYLLHGLGDNEPMLIHSGGFNLLQHLCDRRPLGHFSILTTHA